ncbi:uncharacterized protein PAC_20127 [Phialocephala subalpina]|uniref:Isopenicillin N synthase-like Fe(2+) 2OG dioxygenase domain-containing protein n=1 Tax=Phialocephala subalpina TaxID=576137 RepID=A0A1L7XZ27_9HELO|nr:uncharacterized protein PAC_20127 [Phialocephala subalpina]
MTTERDPNRVYYRAGGFEQSRPILKGADAKETFEFIPIVDVTNVFSPDLEVRKKLAVEIGRAVTEVGFFYAVNPPVDTRLMGFEQSRPILKGADAKETFEFIPIVDVTNVFSPDLEVRKKLAVEIGRAVTEVGFFYAVNPPVDTRLMGILLRMILDVIELIDYPGSVPLNQWPDDVLPELRKVVYEYYRECFTFAKALIRIFALALDLEETAFDETFNAPLTDILIQHYFASPDRKDHEEILFPHADFSAFTLLLNQRDIPGLEVLNANGIWVPAPPIEHAFVVNTGAYFELLSNSRFPATLGIERFSFPIFYSPDPATFVKPHPALVKEGEESKHTPHHIGQRYIKGLVHNAPDHPWVKKLKASGIKEEDYKWELLSQPFAAENGTA